MAAQAGIGGALILPKAQKSGAPDTRLRGWGGLIAVIFIAD
jgi:hypothetical protein